jgi:hypothetical protein
LGRLRSKRSRMVTRYVGVKLSHVTPSHVLLQQSVVGSHEESWLGLPNCFLIWRRAFLSSGLQFSELAGMMLCVVRIRRSNMHEEKCCMVADIILFFFCFICLLLDLTWDGYLLALMKYSYWMLQWRFLWQLIWK